jgi:hypothetical protein
MHTRLATTPRGNRGASFVVFSSEQYFQAYAHRRGTVLVMMTRASPTMIHVIPLRLPAMIQAAYRGT